MKKASSLAALAMVAGSIFAAGGVEAKGVSAADGCIMDTLDGIKNEFRKISSAPGFSATARYYGTHLVALIEQCESETGEKAALFSRAQELSVTYRP